MAFPDPLIWFSRRQYHWDALVLMFRVETLSHSTGYRWSLVCSFRFDFAVDVVVAGVAGV